MYIPPNDSIYYDDVYFANLRLLINHFRHCTLIICGDLNSRINNVLHKNPETKHTTNPDSTINPNGKALIDVLQDNDDTVVLNGLIKNHVTFESRFTFHRASSRSQIDYIITNNTKNMIDFKINDKNIYSDHSPLKLVFNVHFNIDLDFVNDCAKNNFCDNCYDINRRVHAPINWNKVDVLQAVKDMETAALQFATNTTDIVNHNDFENTDILAKKIADSHILLM